MTILLNKTILCFREQNNNRSITNTEKRGKKVSADLRYAPQCCRNATILLWKIWKYFITFILDILLILFVVLQNYFSSVKFTIKTVISYWGHSHRMLLFMLKRYRTIGYNCAALFNRICTETQVCNRNS